MLPTEELYSSLEIAYAHFNNSLFANTLPSIIFTVQRQKGVMGYFTPDRWGSVKGDKCHEIAINPAYIAQSRMIEVVQTLVHEMTHCWQQCFGSPGRGFYHNKEWAYKMMEVGLMPSSTGEPGGDITGQHMSDYIVKDGLFFKAYGQLFEEQKFKLAWVDRKALPRLHPLNIVSIENTISETENQADDKISVLDFPTTINEAFFDDRIHTATLAELMPYDFVEPTVIKKKVKIRYRCPVCNTNVWGKPNIRIRCEDCNRLFDCE